MQEGLLSASNSRSILSKIDILKEYPYARDTEFVAEYLSINYSNKKIVFYGDGQHTADVLNAMHNTENVVSVIAQLNKEVSFIQGDINSNLITDISEIWNLTYDYIVLLGFWSSDAVGSFSKTHDIDGNKIKVVYSDDVVIANSKKIAKQKAAQVTLNFDKNKKNIALILIHDVKDFVSMAAEELSKHFNLTKIYIGSSATDENEFFSNVVYCCNDGDYYEAFLMSHDFDLVVFYNCNSIGVGLAYYTKEFLLGGKKFVFSSYEYIFDKFMNLLDEEIMILWPMLDNNSLEFLKQASAKLLKDANGYISNISGEFFKNELMKKANNPFFSMCAVPTRTFVNSEYVRIDEHMPIEIAFAGGVSARAQGRIAGKDTALWEALDMLPSFEEMASAGAKCSMHIYTSWHNHDALSDDSTHERVYFYETIPHTQVPDRLSRHHFGLVWFNMTDRVMDVCNTGVRSIFNAKFLTYIAAGLPIIVHKNFEVMAQIVKEHSMGIVIEDKDKDFLVDIILQYDYCDMRKNVRRYQETYISENHPKKLLDYLDRIVYAAN